MEWFNLLIVYCFMILIIAYINIRNGSYNFAPFILRVHLALLWKMYYVISIFNILIHHIERFTHSLIYHYNIWFMITYSSTRVRFKVICNDIFFVLTFTHSCCASAAVELYDCGSYVVTLLRREAECMERNVWTGTDRQSRGLLNK